jgi:hypothetical protein
VLLPCEILRGAQVHFIERFHGFGAKNRGNSIFESHIPAADNAEGSLGTVCFRCCRARILKPAGFHGILGAIGKNSFTQTGISRSCRIRYTPLPSRKDWQVGDE